MDEVNLFETEFYHTVEKICGFMETDFYKKLTPQMRPFFDDNYHPYDLSNGTKAM